MQSVLNQFDFYLQHSPVVALGIAFIAGILTSFTPCIYPLIPVTVGIIGAKSTRNRLHALYLSCIYVCGLALVYAGLGVFAALTGKLFGELSTSLWTYLIMGNIFLAFGLSMLGVFPLEIGFLQNQSFPAGRQSGALTAFACGGVSALVAGPCTTPVLGSLLAYVAARQNILLGFAMLFLFALGMGCLLIVVGTFTGVLSSLPRSGAWMLNIKKGFGVLMILLAEYFLIKAGQLM